MAKKPYTITTNTPDRIIRIKLYVPVTRQLACHFTHDIAQLEKNTKSSGILYDMRGAPNISSVMDNYAFAYEDLPRLKLSRQQRRAVLADPEDDSHHFPETFIRNTGHQLRVFKDEHQAICWLKA